MSDRDARQQRCPLQRGAKEKAAEEGDLSNSVLDKALRLILRRLPG